MAKENRSMTEQARRKELMAQYRQTRPEAGVFRILNTQNHKAVLGSSPNLASVRSKLEFAKSIGSSGVLNQESGRGVGQHGSWLGICRGTTGWAQRLSEDTRLFGIEAFTLEVLEVLETRPEMSQAEILEDLAALEELWREKLDPALLY